MTLLKKYIKPNKKYKVICMSAFVSDDLLKESVSLGVDYFLIKPLEFDVLLNTIQRILNNNKPIIAEIDAIDLLLEKIGFSYNLNGYKYIKYGTNNARTLIICNLQKNCIHVYQNILMYNRIM